MVKIGRTSSAVTNKWKSENYTRILVEIPKKDGDKFKEKCRTEKVTQASILKEAIYKFLNE